MIRLVPLWIIFTLAYSEEGLLGKLQTCKRNDVHIDDCLKSAIQNGLVLFSNGIESLGIPAIEPISIKPSTVPKGNVLSFDQIYSDMKMHNQTTITIEKVNSKINDDKFFIHIVCFAPQVIVNGNYDYQNAILDGVDVTSKGKIWYKYTDLLYYLKLTGDIVQKDNLAYVDIKDTEIDLLKLGEFKIGFESENFEVSKELTRLMNDRWTDLLTDNRKGYQEMYSNVMHRIAHSVFDVLPYDKLFPKN